MNILVTGGGGQLGSELKALSPNTSEHRFYFPDRDELDITDPVKVNRFCRENPIEVMVNCAAYTAVDRAQSDAEAAFLVNREGPAILAACARDIGALLVHLSTDYVFDGQSSTPYREIDPPSPLGIYGRSKWEGEECIRKIAPSHLIIRTSWLYSVYGHNFVKTMLRLGAGKDEIRVVSDQVGAPTSAADLAEAILSIIARYDPECLYRETYHYANEGVCSWYDFAVAIMELAGLSSRVHPIGSDQYPQTAPRPHYSVMNTSLVVSDWGLEIPHWRSSLEVMLKKLLSLEDKGKSSDEREFCVKGKAVNVICKNVLK